MNNPKEQQSLQSLGFPMLGFWGSKQQSSAFYESAARQTGPGKNKASKEIDAIRRRHVKRKAPERQAITRNLDPARVSF